MRRLTALILSSLFALGSLAVLPQSVGAAGWGTIKGKFVVDGVAPKLPAIDASKDAFCVEHKPIDQSVVVDDKGNLANVVVYLRTGRNEKVEVHPDYDAAMGTPAVLDNKYCSFEPHVTLVRTGQPFVIKNSDTVGHNTNIKLMRNGATNTTIAANEESKRVLTKAEAVPLPVDCNIHPFMHGWILVKDDPYMITSAADGTFEIKNVPAGKREFEFWHEVPGRLKKLKYQGGTLNQQGRAQLTVVDGQTLDLGEIKVPASMLK